MKGIFAVRAALAVIALLNIARAEGATRITGSIDSNTVWTEGNDPYLVEGSVTIQKGAVLTLKPGVQVRFSAEGGLLVKGGLMAVGDPGRPVYFAPASGNPAWGGICFISSDPKNSVLRRCVVISGRVAVSESSPLIEQCSLYGATTAIQVGAHSSPVILGNRITANRVGILLSGVSSNPQITKNVLYNNDIALYAQDFGEPRFTGNILYGNKDYNLVDRSPKAFSAAWNDFRTADAEAIARSIYDGNREPQVGKVNFRPFTPPVENHEVQMASTMSAPAFQPRLSLTLDGSYAKGTGSGVPASLTNGLGNGLRVEYQFRSFMSVGVAVGYQAYVGDGKMGTAGSLDLIGRVIPFSGGGFEHYLIGGAGINPLFNRETTPWIGRFHAMAGIGTRYSLDNNWGLDLGMVYNFYTPLARHVDAFSVKLGVGYSFGL